MKRSATAARTGSGSLQNPVEIIVEDNGPGIPEETGHKLFSPFFTTKPGGQGIGLMFVREVLNNHCLTFRLASEQGWTSFVISFAEPDHRDTRQVAAKNYRKLPSPPRNYPTDRFEIRPTASKDTAIPASAFCLSSPAG